MKNLVPDFRITITLLGGLFLGSFPGLHGQEEAKDAEQSLPARIDHTASPAFPAVCHQEWNTCAQDCGHYYLLGFEFNRSRDSQAGPLRFSSRFPWSFLNGGTNAGSELTDGFIVAQQMGVLRQERDQHPELADGWVSGYQSYREAMRRRAGPIHYFPIDTINGLEKAKKWLAGSKTVPGRLLGIDVRLKDLQMEPRKKATGGAGRPLVRKWGDKGDGHTLTLAGYDDRIGIDLNGDGRIGNDLDLNGDGVVSLLDWEKGAFLAVNSFGKAWGGDGMAWVLYRESARSPYQRTHWATGVEGQGELEPHLTLRLSFETEDRSALRFTVGSRTGSTLFRPLLFSDQKIAGPTRAPENSPIQHSRLAKGERLLGALKPGGRQGNSGIEMGFDLSRTWTASQTTAEPFFFEAWTTGTVPTRILEASLRHYDSQGRLRKIQTLTKIPITLGRKPLRLTAVSP